MVLALLFISQFSYRKDISATHEMFFFFFSHNILWKFSLVLWIPWDQQFLKQTCSSGTNNYATEQSHEGRDHISRFPDSDVRCELSSWPASAWFCTLRCCHSIPAWMWMGRNESSRWCGRWVCRNMWLGKHRFWLSPSVNISSSIDISVEHYVHNHKVISDLFSLISSVSVLFRHSRLIQFHFDESKLPINSTLNNPQIWLAYIHSPCHSRNPGVNTKCRYSFHRALDQSESSSAQH